MANGPERILPGHVLEALASGRATVSQIAKRIRPLGWSLEDEETILRHCMGLYGKDGKVRPDGAHWRLA